MAGATNVKEEGTSPRLRARVRHSAARCIAEELEPYWWQVCNGNRFDASCMLSCNADDIESLSSKNNTFGFHCFWLRSAPGIRDQDPEFHWCAFTLHLRHFKTAIDLNAHKVRPVLFRFPMVCLNATTTNK